MKKGWGEVPVDKETMYNKVDFFSWIYYCDFLGFLPKHLLTNTVEKKTILSIPHDPNVIECSGHEKGLGGGECRYRDQV